MRLKLLFVLATCTLMSSLQSCAQVDVKQMTYKALRQHDCRVNQLDSFCERSYAHEFQEYEQLRKEFLLEQQQTQFRVKLDPPTDTESKEPTQ